ncbi:MAG: SIMPL domain-containing protein [Chloroflexi bacterium]|nr:SIMPL domain-containing protein [Chloroflexota bacterium]
MPVEGVPEKGVAVPGFVGAPDAVVSTGFATSPAVIPGIPVRSPSYGYFGQEAQNPTGLWVTGIGEITVKPDLAILSVGVEARSKTVTDARDQAALAMQKIVDALKSRGVAAEDIATQYFSIQPEYRYIEVRNPDGSYGKQELVGYIVTNQAQAKIRKIDDVGPVVDAAAVAGGDLVRINNVQFTVDDPVKFAGQMRELAAKDALGKAKVYADALGVKIGGVTYLAETSSASPVYQKDIAYARGAVAEASVPTPISPDTMKLTTSIQVAFTIVP